MGVEVEVVNRDLEHDGSNLLHDEPYKSDLQQAKAGESHGFHSGFRCSSFSRVRFRPGGPPPVRDRKHLYGFPSNSAKQAAEAEDGNAMVRRSVEMCEAMAEGANTRRGPYTATLENPDDPGKDPYPSAWLFEEITAWLGKTPSEVAISTPAVTGRHTGSSSASRGSWRACSGCQLHARARSRTRP